MAQTKCRILEKAIEKAKQDRILNIIMTHHLIDSKVLAPNKLVWGYPFNTAYASEYGNKFIDKSNKTIAYICGHSHEPNETIINGVPCFLNPHGYPGELDTPHTTFQKVFSVKL